MKNLEITIPMVNGDLFDLVDECMSGREVIHTLAGDDFRPPPRCLCIEAKADDGKTVRITIPFSDSEKASVIIE